MKFKVKAQRTQYADLVVVLPEGTLVTAERVQEELNKVDGKYVLSDVEITPWLPTAVEETI